MTPECLDQIAAATETYNQLVAAAAQAAATSASAEVYRDAANLIQASYQQIYSNAETARLAAEQAATNQNMVVESIIASCGGGNPAP